MGSTSEKRAAVIAAVEDIVAEAPETVAECLYFDQDRDEDTDELVGEVYPVCVVGHLINRLEPETFTAMVALSKTTVPSMPSFLVERLRNYGIRLSFDQDRGLIRALGILQGEQDAGKTWAEALESFKKTLASMDT